MSRNFGADAETRQRLPSRRKQLTDELRHGEHTFLVSCGFDEADQVKEVFANSPR